MICARHGYLDVSSRVLPDLLDLSPALPDNSAHYGLVDQQTQLPLAAVVLLALLVHEGDRHLEDAHYILN